MDNTGRNAVLVVSFGTSYDDTREKTIGACTRRIAEEFRDYEVHTAFTSRTVIRKLGRRGIAVDTPDEALDKLRDRGFDHVAVQPLHVMPGKEFHRKVIGAMNRFRDSFKKLSLGLPLLSHLSDYERVVEMVRGELGECSSGQALVLMGHGSSHPSNACYSQLQLLFEDHEIPAYIGTVEGYPELGSVLTRLRRDGVQSVRLMPFMVVAGDHAVNDMAGEDDSWKTELEAAGMTVDVVLKGLGEIPAIQDLYVEHLRSALGR